MSLKAEEIANKTFKLILSEFSALPLKPFRFSRQYLSIHPRSSRSPPLSTWVTHVKRMRRARGMFVRFPRAYSFFTSTINTPASSSLRFNSARSHSCSSFSNPSAAATSSSPVRKSFTASTSSPSYSRRLRISSLRRRRSRLPLPS